jgi:hypothetical protein
LEEKLRIEYEQKLKDKDYQIQEAWERVHALEDDLHNSEYQNTLLAQKLTDISK